MLIKLNQIWSNLDTVNLPKCCLPLDVLANTAPVLILHTVNNIGLQVWDVPRYPRMIEQPMLLTMACGLAQQQVRPMILKQVATNNINAAVSNPTRNRLY